jgi:hypothetical protein
MVFTAFCERQDVVTVFTNRKNTKANFTVYRAAVSRNRYGVAKTVDTHKILINAIQCYVCLQEI